jgi:hypothetical protein
VDVEIHGFLTSALIWSGRIHAPAVYSGERAPSIHCIGGWVAPRAGLADIEGKKSISYRDPTPTPWSPSPPYRLRYPDSYLTQRVPNGKFTCPIRIRYRLVRCWKRGTGERTDERKPKACKALKQFCTTWKISFRSSRGVEEYILLTMQTKLSLNRPSDCSIFFSFWDTVLRSPIRNTRSSPGRETSYRGWFLFLMDKQSFNAFKQNDEENDSTVLCWTLAAFSVSWSFTQSVGLLGRGISGSQGSYLHMQDSRNKE